MGDKTYKIISLRDRTDLNEEASLMFHKKWGVPQEAYLESMCDCQKNISGIPQWYVVINDEEEIIAGAGVIENDFHKRKDLTPNLCALYVKREYRKLGIARNLLDFVCSDLSKMGYKKLYLITGHEHFYEKCGWSYLHMVQENDGNFIRMYKKEI